jgi:hypothetical protein
VRTKQNAAGIIIFRRHSAMRGHDNNDPADASLESQTMNRRHETEDCPFKKYDKHHVECEVIGVGTVVRWLWVARLVISSGKTLVTVASLLSVEYSSDAPTPQSYEHLGTVNKIWYRRVLFASERTFAWTDRGRDRGRNCTIF